MQGSSANSIVVDSHGNTLTSVTGSNTTTYAWDFENRLTSVTPPGSGGTVSFKYALNTSLKRSDNVLPISTSGKEASHGLSFTSPRKRDSPGRLRARTASVR